MDADLDTLCIAVYCTTGDLLPDRPANARRELSDAEVVTLCVAQAIMGFPSDRRFLAAARCQIGHLFPLLPSRSGYHKRRFGLRDTIAWLIEVFAARSPGSGDDLLLMDSTPVECGRSVDTSRRSALSDTCGYGYCASHSRRFWGMRLHWLSARPTAPRSAPRGSSWRMICAGARAPKLRGSLASAREASGRSAASTGLLAPEGAPPGSLRRRHAAPRRARPRPGSGGCASCAASAPPCRRRRSSPRPRDGSDPSRGRRARAPRGSGGSGSR